MSCCNNDYLSKNESIMILNKAREAAACAEANCGSSFTNATNAAISATNAAASAAAAATSAEIAGIYLGPKAVAPTTDNEGGPLQEGMLYYNTVSNAMFVWNGTTWQNANVAVGDGDKGDITVSGVGTVWTIDNDAVTFAKMQNISSPRLLGRATAGTGDVEQLTLGNGLSFTGTALTGFNETTNFLATGTTTARNLVTRSIDFVNPIDFGAIGDGNSHPLSSVYPTLAAAQAVYPFVTSLSQEIDWAAIQAAVNEAMKTGKMVYIIGPGPYMISDTIVVKITRDCAPVPPSPGSDVHFLDLTNATIIGYGMPTLKATTAVASMMELIFDTSDSDLGPFYSKIEGIGFDGNNLAITAIKSDYTMHSAIVRNRIWNIQRGIEYNGYAVALIQHNTIRAKYALYFPGPGGGDSMVFANDFYSPQGIDSACCYFGYYSGNTKISGNTFTNEYGSANLTYGIQVAGGPTSGQENRDLVIENNEFSGFTAGIRMDGQASGNKNVYRIIVTGNRTLPYGSQNNGLLVSAADCRELHIVDNLLNGISLNVATGIGIDLVRCQQTKIADNKFTNYNINTLVLSDCEDTEVTNNVFIDCAKSGQSFVVINLYGTSSARNYFKNNYFRQSNSASFGEYGIVENAGVDYTFSFDNIFDGFERPHTKVGANSIMQRKEYSSTIPATGSFYQGDIVWNTTPSAGGTPGWVCTTSGVNTFVFKAMSNLAP